MIKQLSIAVSLTLLGLSLVSNAYAHVTVKPGEVKIGQYQNFSVSVPTEKGIPTTTVRLVIPDGLEGVRPNVKPGWRIELKKAGSEEEAKISEIIWSGGSIPADQRDEFIFSAKTPSKATTLNWKAYQTYQDGSIVAWDQDPTIKSEDFSKTGPFSTTKIIDDLNSSASPQTITETEETNNNPEIISYAALLTSVVALGLSVRRMKQ